MRMLVNLTFVMITTEELLCRYEKVESAFSIVNLLNLLHLFHKLLFLYLLFEKSLTNT